LFLKLGFPPISVFYAMIAITLCCNVLRIIIVANLTGMNIKEYFGKVVLNISLVTLPLLGLEVVFRKSSFVNGHPIIYILVCELFFITVVMIFGISHQERSLLLNIVKRKLLK